MTNTLNTTEWETISSEIDIFRQVYNIAGTCLKSEYEYVI